MPHFTRTVLLDVPAVGLRRSEAARMAVKAVPVSHLGALEEFDFSECQSEFPMAHRQLSCEEPEEGAEVVALF